MDSWYRFSLMILVSIFFSFTNIIADDDELNYILYEANDGSADGQSIVSVRDDVEGSLDGKTAIVIHDEFQSPETPLIQELKDALIEARQVNVILVNWTVLANQSDVATGDVGDQVANFVDDLHIENVVNITDVHCIGYGIGAHICGSAGETLLVSLSEQLLSRISGLDPTFEMKTRKTISRIISSSDATFVDNIHTSMHGNLWAQGHVDFYANRGRYQPGCEKRDYACNHLRALQYYISSVRRDCQFSSRSCLLLGEYSEDHCDLSEDKRGQMGYDSPEAPGRGVQYLETTDTEPFC